MDMIQDLKVEIMNSGSEVGTVIRRLSVSFHDFYRAYNFSRNRSPYRLSQSEREEKFRKRTATYEEYYFRNHSRRKNGTTAEKSIISRNARTQKSLSEISMNTERSLNDLNLFRSRYRSLSSGQSSLHSTMSGKSQTSSVTHNLHKFIKTPSYGQIYYTRISPSSSTYTDSGLEDIYSERDDCVFETFGVKTDSISDVKLDDNKIQITIFHEHKRNLLTLSIHRASPILTDVGKLFAQVSVKPNKRTKQKGKTINVERVKSWEEDFVFKKLTIGQLESGSVTIKIYQKVGIFKSPILQYVAKVDLKNVDIKDFGTTILDLQKS